MNSSRERVEATRSSNSGITRLPTTTVKATSVPTLRTVISTVVAMVGGGSRRADEYRQQHECDDREHVLDNEPAHGDVSRLRMQLAVVRQHAHEHHGARHRQRYPENQTRPGGPPGPAGNHVTECGSDRAGNHGAWHRNAPYGHQLLDVELEPDTEHQEDDTELGELFSDRAVGHESGAVGTDEDPGEEIPHNR